MDIIKVENLTIGYGKNIIKGGLNFSIKDKDYCCIIGENGSGKTTFMRTLLTLIKPIDGKIEFLNGLKANEIGYLPQMSEVQKNFPALCIEVVMSGCLNHMGLKPFYSEKEKKEAMSNLEKLDAKDLAKKSFFELSGGQKQRVLLARALCSAKKVLLLDEPVTGLDEKSQKEMFDLIDKLNKEGMTIIMITHDIEFAKAKATNIIDFNKL